MIYKLIVGDRMIKMYYRHHYACSFDSLQDIRSIYRNGVLLESLNNGGQLVLSENGLFVNKNPSGLSSAIEIADLRIWLVSLGSSDLLR